jgi:hypothetical protein
VNWDLWVYLFRAELHTATTPEPKTLRAVRAGGVTIAVRETRRELYIPCTMTTNNAEWERGWFYLHNNSDPPMPRARARARGAAARAGAGGAQEGEEHPATGAPGTEERGVPIARAAGALLPWDFRVLFIGRGGRGRKRWGSGSPREVGAFAPLA